MKRINWKAIKKEYLSGKYSKTEIAKKHKITTAAIRYHASKENWKSLMAQEPKSAVTKTKQTEQLASPKKTITPKKCSEQLEIDYNEEHLKMYEDCARIIRAITKLYLDSDLEPDAGALQKLVASIEKIQKGQRVSLGLDKDSGDVSLPTINIVENLDREKL